MALSRHRAYLLLLGLTGLCGCSVSTAGTAADGAGANGSPSSPSPPSGTPGTTSGTGGGATTGATTPGSPSEPPRDAGDNAPDAALPGCPLQGTLGLRILADVSWAAEPLLDLVPVPVLDEGSGELGVWVLVELERTGTQLRGTMQVCHATLPEFHSGLLGERYEISVESSVWDAPSMPRVPVQASLQCPEAGCTVRVPPFPVLIGVQMRDPTGEWPTDRELLTYPDHDGDGYAGITLVAAGPESQPTGEYAYPPVSFQNLLVPVRADRVMLGLRAMTALEGQLDSCEAISGTAPTFSLDTHAPTCRVAGGSVLGRERECTMQQSTFLDDNLPQWNVETARFDARWLGDSASCSDVRTMLGAE